MLAEFLKTGILPPRKVHNSRYRRRYGMTLDKLSYALGVPINSIPLLEGKGEIISRLKVLKLLPENFSPGSRFSWFFLWQKYRAVVRVCSGRGRCRVYRPLSLLFAIWQEKKKGIFGANTSGRTQRICRKPFLHRAQKLARRYLDYQWNSTAFFVGRNPYANHVDNPANRHNRRGCGVPFWSEPFNKRLAPQRQQIRPKRKLSVYDFRTFWRFS